MTKEISPWLQCKNIASRHVFNLMRYQSSPTRFFFFFLRRSPNEKECTDKLYENFNLLFAFRIAADCQCIVIAVNIVQ